MSASFARLQAFQYEMQKDPTIAYHQQNSIGTATRADGKSINFLTEFGLDRCLARAGMAIDEDFQCNGVIGYAFTQHPAVTTLVGMAPLYAIEYIESQAGMLQTQVGGQLKCPAILQQPGSGRTSVTQHANVSAEAKYNNIPGLVVVNPNKVYDVKGLTHTAVRYGGPVVVVQYGSESSADIPDEPFVVPFGQGIVRTAGKDLTIVATPPACIATEGAITELAKAGIAAEYWEPRTTKPLDEAGLIASVKKTGKAFFVSHGYWTGDYTGHMMAIIAMALPGTKMWRITYPDTSAPFSKEMNAWMIPDQPKIVDAVQKFVRM
jgi:pyruvate dehydrogenase E1 component beta subunit